MPDRCRATRASCMRPCSKAWCCSFCCSSSLAPGRCGGPAGDFTTAPEISQMFGELLGLWAAEAWTLMGSPSPVHLVELGPGRGTLMADALRAARVVPGLSPALQVHLVETSPALVERQKQELAKSGVPIVWHASVDDVPDGPAIFIANESFDALPVRHYVN